MAYVHKEDMGPFPAGTDVVITGKAGSREYVELCRGIVVTGFLRRCGRNCHHVYWIRTDNGRLYRTRLSDQVDPGPKWIASEMAVIRAERAAAERELAESEAA